MISEVTYMLLIVLGVLEIGQSPVVDIGFHADEYSKDYEGYKMDNSLFNTVLAQMYMFMTGNWIYFMLNTMSFGWFGMKHFPMGYLWQNNMMGYNIYDRQLEYPGNIPMGAMMGRNIMWNNAPGPIIMQLFNNRDKFTYKNAFYDDNYTIVWVIQSTPELIYLLETHINQMKSILESGGTPRPNDPVFVYEAKLSKYIDTNVYNQGDKLIVVKTAENQCAYEIIKLHAKVVEGFFTLGMEEAMKIHPVPEEVQEICREYVS